MNPHLFKAPISQKLKYNYYVSYHQSHLLTQIWSAVLHSMVQFVTDRITDRKSSIKKKCKIVNSEFIQVRQQVYSLYIQQFFASRNTSNDIYLMYCNCHF